jgi:iron complex transport system ATP-binding protein
MLSGGRVAAVGTPAEVLTAERIGAVYDVRADVVLADGIPRIDFALAR